MTLSVTNSSDNSEKDGHQMFTAVADPSFTRGDRASAPARAAVVS